MPLRSWRSLDMLLDGYQTIQRFKLFGDDGNLVDSLLEHQREKSERRYRFQAQGHDFEKILERVGKLFDVRREEILGPSKKLGRVMARSLGCYCGVKEIGMTGPVVAELLELAQSAVSRAVSCGESEAPGRKLNSNARRNAQNHGLWVETVEKAKSSTGFTFWRSWTLRSLNCTTNVGESRERGLQSFWRGLNIALLRGHGNRQF